MHGCCIEMLHLVGQVASIFLLTLGAEVTGEVNVTKQVIYVG